MTSVADKLAQKTERRTAKKQVRLRLVHIDFWSVVKLALLMAIAIGIAMVVAAVLLWMVVQQTGVIDSVDGLLNDVTGSSGVTVSTFVSFEGLLVFSAVCAGLQIIVTTALAAIAAFIYNLSVRVTGGLVFGFSNT
ncbi:MAG: DUF3566 domain-containing protein [Microbacteriaceae bacterium]|nr:DUF3566 domain-containing protein [Microbacteriaceae bacterium]